MTRTCIRTSLRDRLLHYSSADPNSGCWLWTGGCFATGYGMTTIGKGFVVAAHRASYMEFVGSIPEGKFVCHKCDTPTCINPNHLFLGEPKENSSDMVRKGRSAKGSRQGQSKLKEHEVGEIRSLILQGKNNTEIGASYGVCPGTIHHIRNNRSWVHVQ